MRRRTVLTGILVWVLVVVAASAVTWTVIDGAGEDLMANGSQVDEQPMPLTSASPTASTAASRRPDKPGRSPASPAASPTPAVTSTRPSAPTSVVPSPRGVEHVWQGQAGLLAVRCEGPRAYNAGATPNNGYRVEVEHSGTSELEVTFKSATREYKVTARCIGGVPRFGVEGGGEANDE